MFYMGMKRSPLFKGTV